MEQATKFVKVRVTIEVPGLEHVNSFHANDLQLNPGQGHGLPREEAFPRADPTHVPQFFGFCSHRCSCNSFISARGVVSSKVQVSRPPPYIELTLNNFKLDICDYREKSEHIFQDVHWYLVVQPYRYEFSFGHSSQHPVLAGYQWIMGI